MIVAIGMDPGETVGLCRLTYTADSELIMVDVVQCTRNTSLDLLQVLLRAPKHTEIYFQVERYVRNLRGGGGPAGSRTRDLVGSAVTLAGAEAHLNKTRTVVTQRSASDAKTWATDKRLTAAGLMQATKGMGHARDAARHALQTAVAEGNIPDPFSKKAKDYGGSDG